MGDWKEETKVEISVVGDRRKAKIQIKKNDGKREKGIGVDGGLERGDKG